MTKPRTNVYVWSTWLSKLMAGETQCQWGVWFKAHNMDYAKAPSGFESTQWQLEHNRCLDELCAELRPQALTLYRENQNKYSVPRGVITIAGKPDLIVLGKDGSYTVYDVKTGQAKHSDIVQVMFYMACLPYANSPLYKGKKINGCVVYKANRTEIPAETIDDKFNKQVGHYLDIIALNTPPATVPCFAECCYCEITKEDCPDKIESDSGIECSDLPI